jgi:hypothetical protein
MFSRRVVEVAASGSLVLSGKGRGIREQIEGIEASESPQRWEELLDRWMRDESSRLDDTWMQLRSVTRSHLAEQALGIMFRTAGINVTMRSHGKYVLVAGTADVELLTSILEQTVRPSGIVVSSAPPLFARRLAQAGVKMYEDLTEVPLDAWVGNLEGVPSDTYYEDLLYATRFGQWDGLSARTLRPEEKRGSAMVELSNNGTHPSLTLRSAQLSGVVLRPLTWIYPEPEKR